MSVRVTSGTSWPGKRPGVRHWFSVSSYVDLWSLGLGGIIIGFVLGPLVLAAMGAWIGLEALVLIASGLLIAVNLALGMKLDWRFAHWQRLAFGLWSVLVPERGEL
jgi:hypothetical protein